MLGTDAIKLQEMKARMHERLLEIVDTGTFAGAYGYAMEAFRRGLMVQLGIEYNEADRIVMAILDLHIDEKFGKEEI